MIKCEKLYELLKGEYPDAKVELNYSNPFELLIATILSAQCTDVRVNIVTEKLFSSLKTPSDFRNIGLKNLAEQIKPCGLHNSKAKNIINACEILIRDHNGHVPSDRNSLEKLPGVGRKTANVVLSNAFNIPAFAVDTHVHRVLNRLGVVDTKDPLETELKFIDCIDEGKLTLSHHLIIFHGRRVCKARKPLCNICVLKEECYFMLRGGSFE